jgi:tRNA nucleotidyltransferase (CCA-adding enzyme)
MEIYLVGGAVRDQLLGLPVKEKDWVVTGATPADMLKKGFRQVGKDFPVFLHPDTHEEYALARLERKTGPGYTGFDFDASTEVTLEDDLLRRDLTINAIAQTADGKKIVDPFHGQDDIQKKILRHVSPAFIEDPVRILRVARFSARFANLGFTIAPETMAFMQDMVKSGEVNALVAERVWKELERALQEKNPEQFFQVLADCGALAVLFPDLNNKHIELLTSVSALTDDGEVRFAALFFYLTLPQIKNFCEQYRVGSAYRDFAVLIAQRYQDTVNAKKLSSEELLSLLQSADAFRREGRFKKWLTGSVIIAKALSEDIPEAWLLEVYNIVKKIDFSTANNPDLKGKEIGDYINKQRLEAIKKFQSY